MRRFWALTAGILALLTAVFFAAGALGFDEAWWAAQLKASQDGPWLSAALIFAALSLDLFLPVPSSVVMTIAGSSLGFVFGSLVNIAGALACSFLGYGLCRRFGAGLFTWIIGAEDEDRVRAFFERYGAWAILLSRPLPMLTEAVACLAGFQRMPFLRFAALATAGTIPVALVYAWAGERALDDGIVIALAAALMLPAAGFLAVRRWAPTPALQQKPAARHDKPAGELPRESGEQ